MDENLKNLSNFLHTILCNGDHNAEMIDIDKNKSKCCYYIEDSMEKTWECRDHVTWKTHAEIFMRICSMREISLRLVCDSLVHMYNAYAILKSDETLLEYARSIMKCKGDKDEYKSINS